MLYAMIGEDVPDSLEKRLVVRAEHLARLKQLADAGRLVLAGPLPAIDNPDPGPAGFVGSLIVAEFGSLEEAEDWAANDPYATHGIFARMNVLPFKQVLP